MDTGARLLNNVSIGNGGVSGGFRARRVNQRETVESIVRQLHRGTSPVVEYPPQVVRNNNLRSGFQAEPTSESMAERHQPYA